MMAAIQPEMLSGESVVWAGQPGPRAIFHREDLFLIPFSLMWGGFAIFWELGVLGMWPLGNRHGQPWGFGVLWGIPFVLIGQYLIWGRFLYASWKRVHIYYALTDRRVITVQEAPVRRVESAYLDTLSTVVKSVRSDGTGTLTFAQPQPLFWRRGRWGVWDPLAVGDVPAFVDVDNADEVYRLVAEQREKARSAKAY